MRAPALGKSTAELIRDADHYATELIRRYDQLARRERGELTWQQAAKITRRVRSVIRART